MIQEALSVQSLPRPNLGPEPWPDPYVHSFSVLIIIGLSLVAIVLIAARVSRRLIRQPGIRATPDGGQPEDHSPRGQVLRMAAEARRALATRLGATMRARTTEELADDPKLREAVGGDSFDSLMELLVLADQWKFASPSENGVQEPDPERTEHWNFILQELARRKRVKSPHHHSSRTSLVENRTPNTSV